MRLLFVGSANTRRSPMAEHIAKASLKARRLRWTVSSAGLAVIAGQPMAPHAEAAMKRRKLKARHRSTPVDDKLIASADYILTMTVAQRDDLVERFPGTTDRTESLLRFIDTVADETAETESGHAVDIIDPVGSSPSVYEDCAIRLERSIKRVIDKLETQLEVDRLLRPKS